MMFSKPAVGTCEQVKNTACVLVLLFWQQDEQVRGTLQPLGKSAAAAEGGCLFD